MERSLKYEDQVNIHTSVLPPPKKKKNPPERSDNV